MPPDRAYWITWYNLPEAHRDAHLQWVEQIYLPKVVARDGVLWGAHYASLPKGEYTPLGGVGGRIAHKPDPAGVPAGDRYILIFGASEVYSLVNPTPAEFHATFSDADRATMAQRVDARHNFMLEEGRVEGDALSIHSPRMLPSAAIQLGSFQPGDWKDEDEQAAWYARWRLPSLQSVPGCLRVRKLVSVAGWAKHACFYEFTSVEDREKHFVHYESARPDMVKWSTDVVRNTIHAPGSANIARRIAVSLKTPH
jgi:hypothetical protein